MPRLALGRNLHVASTAKEWKIGGFFAGPKLLHRYLAREVGAVLLVAAPSISVLIGLLQGVRLAPLVAGADLGLTELAQVTGLMMVPLASVALPAAAVISLLVAFGRLAGDGELIALRAAGAGTARIAAAPLTLCALVSLATGASALWLEPAAYGELHLRLGGLLTRAALGEVRPGVITELSPGVTVLCRDRSQGRLEGVFIEDRRGASPVQLFAAAAELTPRTGRPAVRLVLEEGELQERGEDGALTRASFSRLETELELTEAAGELAAIVPPRLSRGPAELLAPEDRGSTLLLHRRLALAPATLGLCLLTIFLGLWRPAAGRPAAIVAAALMLLGSHLLTRAGEAAVGAEVLPAVAGGWLPAAVVWVTVLIIVLFYRR